MISELRSYPGADGMKTGYTIASGHNLITSAVRDGVRLIGVQFGAPSNGVRDIRMTAMLNTGYESMGVQVGRPVMVAARMPSLTRMPSLITAAHAEEMPRVPPPPILHASHTDEHRVAFRHHPSGQLPLQGRRATGSHEGAWGRPVGRCADQSGPHSPRHHLAGRGSSVGMSSGEAREACTTLAHRHTPCVVTRSASASELSRS